VCIAMPMVLTGISLILLLVVFLGGLNKGDSNLSSLYYFKADTSNFKETFNSTDGLLSKLDIPGTKLDDKLKNFLTQLSSSNSKNKLQDVYEVYLWNYCSGDIIKGNSSNVKLTYCSPRKAQFWFDPVTVWGLNGTGVQNLLPKELNNGLNIYKKVSQWMFVAYAIAFWVTASSIVVGLLGICSRWGSCLTTIVSSAATLFTFLAALTSTILFSTLTGTFNTALKTYGIHITLGTKMLSLDWVAFVFSFSATLFWTISMCCCSGKSDRKHKGEKAAHGRAPMFGSKGYQKVGEAHAPYGGHQRGHSNLEMENFAAAGGSPYKGRETAYEPFRHERG